MAGVVAPAVAQVDPADEGDVPRRLLPVLNDDQLLVVRAEPPHPLVEQHLGARLVELRAEPAVRLRVEAHALGVRAPHQPPDLDARPGEVAEHVADAMPLGGQLLVGVTPPVGEEEPVAGAQGAELLVEPLEVDGPVHQRAHEVALRPALARLAGAARGAAVEVGVGVAALPRGQEPSRRRVVSHGAGVPVR